MADTPLGSAEALSDLLGALAKTIDGRVGGDPKTSYTAKLLSKGGLHCGKKIAEEGAELALAIAAQGGEETASEAADLFYHVLVGLRAKNVSLNAVAKALTKRRNISGIAEKKGRKS